MTAPGPVRRWVLAARLRTLPAAVVPVALGAVSVSPAAIRWSTTLLAAVVAVALQVATNYANDYSDGIRGTDDVRVGPFRLTASGLVEASAVRTAALLFFAAAALGGVVLSALTTWWLIPLGASAIAAGWLYTGGPRPYGYMGLGELFVMTYFGFVATVGTAYVQHGHIPARAWWLALAAGSMACALLEANNLRDVDTDVHSGKRTLAARLGVERAHWLYATTGLLATVGFAGGAWPAAPIALIGYGLLWRRFAAKGLRGRELLPLLMLSARLQLALGVLAVVSVELLTR